MKRRLSPRVRELIADADTLIEGLRDFRLRTGSRLAFALQREREGDAAAARWAERARFDRDLLNFMGAFVERTVAVLRGVPYRGPTREAPTPPPAPPPKPTTFAVVRTLASGFTSREAAAEWASHANDVGVTVREETRP